MLVNIRTFPMKLIIVGYPYQGPRSSLGKLLSIGIASIGLPIFLLYSWLVGRFLGRHLELGYNKLLCCSSYRQQENQEERGEERKEGRREERRRVPGWLCLVIILTYLALGTVIMSLIHRADMIDSLLYTFSLLVTIGVTLDSEASLLGVLVTSLYIILGVAIMSMCGFCLSRDLTRFLQSLSGPS